MFSLNHLKGNTYYIDAPTNIGVYKLSHNDCILIDTCYQGDMTDHLLATLSKYNLNVKSILHTHAHVDHFGSDSYIKSKYSCTIGAPKVEYTYIENPQFTNLLVFNTSPFRKVSRSYPTGAKVDYLYDENSFDVNDVSFSTFPLKGHSQNQKGIITPDNVIFTGDTFLDIEELKSVKLLYNYDVEGALDSLKSLSNTSYSIYIPSHGSPLEDVKNTIKYNVENLQKNANMIFDIIKNSPIGLDELMSILVKRYKVTEHATQYLIAQACITSLLSYLENQDRIKIIFENGVMKFSPKD